MKWYASVTLCHWFHTIVNVKLDLVVFEFTDTRAQTWIFAADLVGFPVGNVRCASNDMNQSQHIGGITA